MAQALDGREKTEIGTREKTKLVSIHMHIYNGQYNFI